MSPCPHPQRPWACLAAVLALAAAAPVAAQDANDVELRAGRGPVILHVPDVYDGSPLPLVMLLHGYGASGDLQEAYMQFLPLSEQYGFHYLYPDGNKDLLGLRFWNATNACCDIFNENPNDSAYLRDLIDEAKAAVNVDPSRVWLIGHSNGGFMSYRMACDHSEMIAAIASLAGATWKQASRCSPDQSVHVLQIHGTLDTTVLYGGGCFPLLGCYPGARESVSQWIRFDDCDLFVDRSQPNKNLDALLLGDETTVEVLDRNCLPGGSGELWSIVGGGHIPLLSNDFSREVIDFLYAHPKP